MKKPQPFAAFVAAIVTLYATAAWSGWEVGGGKRGFVPRELRQSPGGYRSYAFWRGGK